MIREWWYKISKWPSVSKHDNSVCFIRSFFLSLSLPPPSHLSPARTHWWSGCVEVFTVCTGEKENETFVSRLNYWYTISALPSREDWVENKYDSVPLVSWARPSLERDARTYSRRLYRRQPPDLSKESWKVHPVSTISPTIRHPHQDLDTCRVNRIRAATARKWNDNEKFVSCSLKTVSGERIERDERWGGCG